MVTIIDGPAEAQSFALGRAPQYLRLVVDAGGKWDALDQIDDEPKRGERVHVYRLMAPPGAIHVCRGKGSGRFALAEYEHVPDVDGETLRETEAWRAWVLAQPRPAGLGDT